jgi:hypothetical protein
MKVVGIESYTDTQPFADLLRDARPGSAARQVARPGQTAGA